MQTKIHNKILFSVTAILFSLTFVTTVHAITPALEIRTLSDANSRVLVQGDANAAVELHYGTSESRVTTLGTTNESGNLTIEISNSSYEVGCNKTAYVIVNGQQSVTIPWVKNTNTCEPLPEKEIKFSENNLVLSPRQDRVIRIIGNGGYRVVSNSGAGVAAALITGDKLSLYPSNFGSTNIKVCGSDGLCGTLSVVVLNANTTQSTTAQLFPTLSSFNISSDNKNGQFMGEGNTLTFTFNVSKSVSSATVSINGAGLFAAGSGTGPYVATYKMTGYNTSIPVVIKFKDTAGNIAGATFNIGDQSISFLPPQTAVIQEPTPSPVASALPTVQPSPSPKYVFSQTLKLNSSGEDVTQLQKILTKLGFYKGPITGYFGVQTEGAVKVFQKALGLSQVGAVGPATRVLLNKLQ